MNVKDIKEIIQTFSQAQLTGLELKCDEFELKINKEQKVHSVLDERKIEERKIEESESSQLGLNAIVEEGRSSTNQMNTPDHNVSNNKVITAPIVGTFYRAEQPGAKPLVEVGSYVHKGDVVCIIEAMKLMNEVEAEVEGEVVEILVENEEMVEYSEPLIVLR